MGLNFGNVGDQSLKQVINVMKLTVALMTLPSQINLRATLIIRTRVTAHSKMRIFFVFFGNLFLYYGNSYYDASHIGANNFTYLWYDIFISNQYICYVLWSLFFYDCFFFFFFLFVFVAMCLYLVLSFVVVTCNVSVTYAGNTFTPISLCHH